jgi:hypothetical protein
MKMIEDAAFASLRFDHSSLFINLALELGHLRHLKQLFVDTATK